MLPLRLGVLCPLFVCLAPHGGRYPPTLPTPPPPPVYGGPADAGPPGSPNGSPGSSGAPAGPRSAGPASPSAAGVAPSTARTGGPTTPRGIAVEIDYTTWNYWWEFNKHAYLRLKEAVYSGPVSGSDDYYMGVRERIVRDGGMRPSDADLGAQALPSLRAALALPDQHDITTAALIALAKTDLADADDLATMRRRLSSGLPVVRETAALALGLVGRPEAMDDLTALAHDSPGGRRLCGLQDVDYRLRSFSVYALGLIGRARTDLTTKARVTGAVVPLLAADELRWDVKLAAISALRILDLHGPRSYQRERLVHDCVEALWRYHAADLGRGEVVVQAHVPTAIAGLLGRGGDGTGRYTKAFADELVGASATRALIAQSCALALGTMVSKDDRETCAAIRRGYEAAKSPMTRFLCLIALGRIGGADNRTALLSYLERGNKALEKPWAALALGLLAHGSSGSAMAATVDATIGEALHSEFADNKNDLARSACAVALGLTRYREAAEDLLDVLRRDGNREPLTGYVGLGLALMGEDRAIPELRTLAAANHDRPGILVQVATALAVLGDKGAQSQLTANLSTGEPSLLQLSAQAQALALIGDRRSLPVLVALAADTGRPRLARGYALVGIGGVADRDLLPWHAALASNLNYHAVLETLLDGVQGVLDIL